MNFFRKVLIGVAVLAMIAAPVVFGLAAAQQVAPPPQIQEAEKLGPEFKYDTVSIKLNQSAQTNIGGSSLPDGLDDRDFLPIFFFQGAYLQYAPGKILRPDQIVGIPDWFKSERYDLEAKMDPAIADKLQKMDRTQQVLVRQHMMQQLLADRFALKVHWELRQSPVYFMTVAKDGPRFKEAPPNEDYGYMVSIDGKQSLLGTIGVMQPGTAKFNGVTMDQAAAFVGRRLGRSVIDRTGLTGHYDFLLHWAPTEQEIVNMLGPAAAKQPPPAAPNGQPAFAASDPSGYGPVSPKSIEKQLGLRLEPGTGPVPVVVIDHIEKPTEN